MPDERVSKTVGKTDTKSGIKAKAAADRTVEQQPESDWPRGSDGKPMIKILMTASELIPTGQFANVSIGPAQITAYVDSSRKLDKDESYFTEPERATIAQSLNELAEIVEGDVVAVQRSLVLESLQQQVTGK